MQKKAYHRPTYLFTKFEKDWFISITQVKKYYLENIALFDNNPLSMPNNSYRQTN